jgi:hypothetical protein
LLLGAAFRTWAQEATFSTAVRRDPGIFGKCDEKTAGAKSLHPLSDGVDYGGKTSIVTAIEFAQRADTIIYSIRFADHIHVYRPAKAAILAVAGERVKKALQRLGQETGSMCFEVSKSQPSMRTTAISTTLCAINTAWGTRRNGRARGARIGRSS